MTFDQWFAEQYGNKREQLGLVVPELMRAAYAAADRQGYARGTRHAAEDLASGNIATIKEAVAYFRKRGRLLAIEQSASKEKQHG